MYGYFSSTSVEPVFHYEREEDYSFKPLTIILNLMIAHNIHTENNLLITLILPQHCLKSMILTLRDKLHLKEAYLFTDITAH